MKQLVLLLVFSFSISLLIAQENLDLYLLIGQSNMAGRGVVEAEDTIPLKQVLTLTEDLKWKPAQDPIHFDKKMAGVGLGRSFGLEMLKQNADKKIGLIPCAVGGSPIDSWKPGVVYEGTGKPPWDDMVKRLKFALQHGELKGILWHQGEADSKLDLAPYYGQKLKQLISSLRELVDNPEIPIVAGEMVRKYQAYNGKQFKGKLVYPAMVIKATKLIAKDDENMEFVDSKGLADRGDDIHFNSRSYRELGKRYAKAMAKLQKK